MKKILIALLLSVPAMSFAQKDTTTFRFPVKDSLVFYEKVINAKSNASKDVLFNLVIEWCASMFKNSNDVIKLNDKASGEIVGNGSCTLTTEGLLGSSYNLRYTFRIDVKDGKYRVQVNNLIYYLIPDNRIISSDYSPIERRYFRYLVQRDKESKKLFVLINNEINKNINSLEAFVNKGTTTDF